MWQLVHLHPAQAQVTPVAVVIHQQFRRLAVQRRAGVRGQEFDADAEPGQESSGCARWQPCLVYGEGRAGRCFAGRHRDDAEGEGEHRHEGVG